MMWRINNWRSRIAYWMFDTAARLLPLHVRGVGEAHHVTNNRWVSWEVRKAGAELAEYEASWRKNA